jgi:hypothetical protein
MAETATMTELLRMPRDVVARTEAGAVRITRRDAADLILLRADDLEQVQQGAALVLRIARAALSHGGDMLAGLRSLYPWTALLSESAMARFAAEMDKLVWSSAELGHFGQLIHTFASWQGTAEALADGMRPDEELTWLDLDEVADVPRPE